jgi:1-acyl-sn-glycerol-3-phosphate acyltransferase
MRTVQAVVRLAAILVLTTVMALVWGSGALLTAGLRRWWLRWRGFMVGVWARSMLKCIGVRLRFVGDPPEAPFCLVANHLSYLDVLLLQSRLSCVFVAKSEVASWPVVGWLAAQVGTLFIDRRHHRDLLRVGALIERALAEGDGVVVFPEGTSSAGTAVLPFKASLLDPLSRLCHPVSYASISYRTPAGEPPASLAVCWWGDMTFADHVFGMLRLSYIEATVTFGAETIREEDRKVLARRLEQRVQDQFIPVGTASQL